MRCRTRAVSQSQRLWCYVTNTRTELQFRSQLGCFYPSMEQHQPTAFTAEHTYTKEIHRWRVGHKLPSDTWTIVKE